MTSGSKVGELGISGAGGVLEEWLSLMADRGWGSDDAPWFYGENASTSLFAGAAWRTSRSWWCFSEFGRDRQVQDAEAASLGRADLLLAHGGRRILVEAKQIYPSLSKRCHLEGELDASIQDAGEQAGQYARTHAGYEPCALVFIVPRVSQSLHGDSVQYNERIASLVELLSNEQEGASAWHFPKARRNCFSERAQHFYPGIGMVLRLV